METANVPTKEDLQSEIEALKEKLTGDMFQDMELHDKIHNLEMQVKGVRPMDSFVECVGCSG